MAYKPVNKFKRRHVSLQILMMNDKHKKSALLIWKHQTLVTLVTSQRIPPGH